MIFPVLCPLCHADSGVRVIPQSPEVESFRCGDCHHEWSEPVRAVSSEPLNDGLESRWRALFQQRSTIGGP